MHQSGVSICPVKLVQSPKQPIRFLIRDNFIRVKLDSRRFCKDGSQTLDFYLSL